MYNDGDPSGFYLSVAGPARNFISGPDLSLYMFDWIPGGQEYLTPTDPNQFPGLIPEVPVLIEPFQTNAENNFTLTCSWDRIEILRT